MTSSELKYDQEFNFSAFLLSRAFVPTIGGISHFNPYDNWFGVSQYHPDEILKRGNKEVILSLQGVLTPFNSDLQTLFKNKSIRYLCFREKEKIIYETFTGELPSQKFTKNYEHEKK